MLLVGSEDACSDNTRICLRVETVSVSVSELTVYRIETVSVSYIIYYIRCCSSSHCGVSALKNI